MTRKDYVLLADAIKAVADSIDYPERLGAQLAANEIAHRLQRDNPRFDRERFLKAAGLSREDGE